MLSKEIAQQVLGRCLVTGGDFAEIFEEDTIDNSISILNGKVENSIGGRAYGIGIRIFKGLKSVYAYTNNNSLHSLLQTAEKAALALGELKEDISIYRNNDARISSFSLQSANDTKYTTFNNREYASLQLVYYIREGSNLRTSGTKFTLRKDNSGKWKILYWELVDSVDLS